MSRFEFHQLFVHGQTLWMTDECRRLNSSKLGGKCQMYLIPAESPLSLSHLFVLLMYCNLTKLQAEYKKHGCRGKIRSVVDEEALKKRNSKIGWWYKLIFESVFLWGTKVAAADIF